MSVEGRKAVMRECGDVLDRQFEDEVFQPEEISLVQFCEFIEYYTRHSTDPMCTTLVCEKQAEVVRIMPQDVSRESIQMLIDTMLNAMDHLEKRWLDEQLQREEHVQYKVLQRKPERTLKNHRLTLLWQTWLEGAANRVKRKVSYAR
jgi:hypothetical protein